MSTTCAFHLKDDTGADLIPGALYCCFERVDTGEETFFRDGALVWFAGDGNFYDEDGEGVYPDYDFLVRQTGSFDKEYAVFTV